jgi:peptidoglycan/xylan/chitin deacetylase (PgdA/CDA1 family)
LPAIGTRRIVVLSQSQGFLLGNHTWAHPEMPSLTPGDQSAEMDRATAEQRSLVGTSPCVFRSPYREYDGTTLGLAQGRRMRVWNWAHGSSDPYWVDRIVRLAEVGGHQAHPVVLMHNQPGGQPATLAALPQIIMFYRDRGYAFVDLFGHHADQPVTGDWDGDGDTTPDVVRGDQWFLRNSDTSGAAHTSFTFAP